MFSYRFYDSWITYRVVFTIASYPGSWGRGKRAWYAPIAHALNPPNFLGIPITIAVIFCVMLTYILITHNNVIRLTVHIARRVSGRSSSPRVCQPQVSLAQCHCFKHNKRLKSLARLNRVRLPVRYWSLSVDINARIKKLGLLEFNM